MAPDPSDRWDSLGPDGSTPLGDDEARGLRLSWVATRGDLNEAEQGNILAARRKRRWRTPSVNGLLDDLAVRILHRDMFGQVWTWAGTYRNSEMNIGVVPHEISVCVRTSWTTRSCGSPETARCPLMRPGTDSITDSSRSTRFRMATADTDAR